MIDIEANKNRFNSLLSTIKRIGICEMLDWLESTDVYEAPASTKYHLSAPGGLVEHSLSVYDTLRKLDDVFCTEFNSDSMVITALLHDLCKTNYYVKERRWRKDANGRWEDYMSYGVKDVLPLGHSPKSVYLITKFVAINDEEAAAIIHHMGCWNPSVALDYSSMMAFNSASEKYPLVALLSSADWLSSRVTEKRFK